MSGSAALPTTISVLCDERTAACTSSGVGTQDIYVRDWINRLEALALDLERASTGAVPLSRESRRAGKRARIASCAIAATARLPPPDVARGDDGESFLGFSPGSLGARLRVHFQLLSRRKPIVTANPFVARS
jgi:hypothetical protein